MNTTSTATDIHHALTWRTVLHSLVDLTLVVGILSIVNLLVSRHDFGWLALNPTPFVEKAKRWSGPPSLRDVIHQVRTTVE